MLALLALAVPLPALALSDQSAEPVAERGPAAISVSAALDSCGIMDGGVVCKINVSYTQVPGATSYSATVTGAGGSVTDYGAVGAGATSLYVPYSGDGDYSVRITAYGAPQEPGDEDAQGEVIATGVANPGNNDARRRPTPERENDAAAGGRDADAATIEGPGGQLQTEPAPQPAATPAPACEQPPPPAPVPEPLSLPEPPPEDLDPEDADEDADGNADADEKVAYESALAAQQAAAAQPPPAPPTC